MDRVLLMIKFILFFCFTLLATDILGQQGTIDSLRGVLQSYPQNNPTKVDLMLDLAYAYRYTKPDSNIVIANQAHELATQIGYGRGRAWALHRIANAYWLKGNFPMSMEHAFKALSLADSLKDPVLIANCYNLIANNHNMEGELAIAITYYQKSAAMFIAAKDSFAIVRAYSNIGRTYYMEGKYDSALYYLQQSISNYKPAYDKSIYAAALNTMGDTYQKLGQNDRALAYYFQSLRVTEPTQLKRYITYSNRGISEVYQQQGKLRESIDYAKRTLAMSAEIGYKENLKNAAFILSANYQKLGDYQKALDFQLRGNATKDSMFSIEKNKQIGALQANYEVEKKQREIATLKVAQALQETERKILIMATALFFSLLVLLWMKLRWQQKGKRLLIAQKEEIQQQKDESQAINDRLEEIVGERTRELKVIIESMTEKNQDLEQFSYITSHNLRAPVARIQGLLSVFNQANMADEFNKEILGHLYLSARGLDEILKDLTNILSIRKTLLVKEKINLRKIIDSEINNLKDLIQESSAQINVDLSAIDEIYAIKVYVQSIVHNLLSNAIKYRSHSNALQITIKSCIDRELGFICISIADNGLGFASPDPYKIFGLYQRMHTHVEGKGLGLYLVKTQLEAISGRIEVESEVNQGTTFRIYLPIVPTNQA